MTTDMVSQSGFQIALKNFRNNKIAVVCVAILFAFYFSAIFAGFFAPYSFKTENRNLSYCPPTPIQFFDEGKFIGPYVTKITMSRDKYLKRVYTFDNSEKYPIKFFAQGEKYKMFWLIPFDRHLFTVNEEARVYLLGADSRGRDLFSRLIYGGRVSLFIGLVGVAISFSIGLLVGGVAGYYGGRVDNILMRLVELIIMIPGFYLMLALISRIPANLNTVQTFFFIVFILSFIGWGSLARVIRGMCLSIRERDYVLAARALGLSDFKIITRHILPHTISYSIFAVMLSIPGYILGESALSLLGLGIEDPFASWGNMLSDAMGVVRIKLYPWILWPGFFIFVTVVCFNIIGNALRDALDPMLKSEGER